MSSSVYWDQLKIFGVPMVLVIAWSYKLLKRKYSGSGNKKHYRLHNQQVETVVKLKNLHKSFYSQVYPGSFPDEKLTIECPACNKINTLYVPHCKHCNGLIYLDSTISYYKDKIKGLELQINENRQSPSL